MPHVGCLHPLGGGQIRFSGKSSAGESRILPTRPSDVYSFASERFLSGFRHATLGIARKVPGRGTATAFWQDFPNTGIPHSISGEKTVFKFPNTS